MTIQLLPCAHPPAVRLTGGSGLTTYFNHTFDDSEVVSVGGHKYIVTLTHPTTNQVGFAVSCMYRLHIIESVDSICRDGADTPISPIQK